MACPKSPTLQSKVAPLDGTPRNSISTGGCLIFFWNSPFPIPLKIFSFGLNFDGEFVIKH